MSQPISIFDPVEQKARQTTWLSNRAVRSTRRKITSRFTLAVSVAAMIVALSFATTQSSNPLEQAQMTQPTITTQAESPQWILAAR